MIWHLDAHARAGPAVRRPALLGVVNAFASLALVLTLGLLAYAPLGAAAGGHAIAAGFVAVITGGLVFALWSGTSTPLAGPSSATALMLATLVAVLAQDPAIDARSAPGLLAIVAVISLAVVGMGLLLLVMGLSGLGRLAQYVPQPVLAGFMNGVAVMILVSQLPPLLGLPPLSALGDWRSLAGLQPLTLLVGLATACTAWGAARWWPRAPAPLLALAAGCALYALLAHALPGQPLGRLLGPVPVGATLPDALLPLRESATAGLLHRHAGAVLSTAALMALIGALESLLAAVAIDQVTHARHDSRRLLMSLGAANLVSGLCGGLPLVMSRVRALTLADQGATGRLPAVASLVAFALMFGLAGPLLALLPRTVLAGIMLTLAVALVDRWTRVLVCQWRGGDRSPDLQQSLLQVAVVAASTVLLGFAAGVAAGLLLAALVFMRSVNRSLLRSRYTAAQRPSRRIHPPAVEALLQPLRQQILVLELEGGLFFGSAARLANAAEALGPELRHLVVDLKRVSTLDESGAVLLQQLSVRLPQRGMRLWLAGVAADNPHGRRLHAYGCFPGDQRADWLPDIDRATEAAERCLLADAGLAAPMAAVALQDTSLLQGLSAAQIERLRPHLRGQRLAAGALLFRQGDPGDSLYLLTEGSISIVTRSGATAQRFASFSPGVMFGEVALLDEGGRSADAMADTEVQLHALSRDALAAVSAADPALGQLLLRNIALHLAQRLRVSTTADRAGD